jgi:hypothetical protein
VTSLPLLSRSLVRGRGFKHTIEQFLFVVNYRSFSDASSLEILDKLEAAEKVMMILLILRKYINFIQMASIHVLEFHERFASPHDISIYDLPYVMTVTIQFKDYNNFTTSDHKV